MYEPESLAPNEYLEQSILKLIDEFEDEMQKNNSDLFLKLEYLRRDIKNAIR